MAAYIQLDWAVETSTRYTLKTTLTHFATTCLQPLPYTIPLVTIGCGREIRRAGVVAASIKVAPARSRRCGRAVQEGALRRRKLYSRLRTVHLNIVVIPRWFGCSDRSTKLNVLLKNIRRLSTVGFFGTCFWQKVWLEAAQTTSKFRHVVWPLLR